LDEESLNEDLGEVMKTYLMKMAVLERMKLKQAVVTIVMMSEVVRVIQMGRVA
jgi:hypothetical protein